MEVPGRIATKDQQTASTEHVLAFCQPCGRSNKQAAATKYCDDCHEYLCRSCCDDHSKFAVLSHHSLTNVANRAANTKKKQGSKPTVTCKLHTEKLVEFYCRIHNVTACGTCAVLNHTSCKPEYIPDISLGYQGSNEYKGLQDDLDILLTNISSLLDSVKNNLQKTNQNARKIIAEIKAYREEIKTYLAKKEKELVAEVEKMENQDTVSLSKEQSQCNDLKSELRDMKTRLTTIEQNSSDLFIECTDISSKLQNFQDNITKSCKKNQLYSYCFSKNPISASLLSSDGALGDVSKRPVTGNVINVLPLGKDYSRNKVVRMDSVPKTDWTACKVKQQPDLCFKISSDVTTSLITGMAFLPPKILLLVDGKNNSVKRVKLDINSMDAWLQLSSKPWDITTLSPDQAAVTLPDIQKIQIISTKPDLSLLRTIDANGKCYGIDSTTDNRLVVNYCWPAKIEVMDDHGVVLYKMNPNLKGKVNCFSSHRQTQSGLVY